MDSIAVIDFGSQYAHLIVNRVRRLGVYAEVITPGTPGAELKNLKKFKGLILSGGPRSVYEKDAPTIDRDIFDLGVPVLGICYGHQLVAHLLGGKIEQGKIKEYGFAKLEVLENIGPFKDVEDSQVWMSHGDTLAEMPEGFKAIGKTADCAFAAIGNEARRIYSMQFHIEVKHTPEGMKMLGNFLNLCGIKREWRIDKFLDNKLREIKEQLAGRKVFLLVSGGVDSTVAFALLSKALGTENVYGLYVDTGLQRKGESEKVAKSLRGIGVKNFHLYQAGDKFLTALKGVIEPEAKRKIIGDMFLEVQAEAIRKLKLNPNEWVLGQGTIYPDTIESAGTKYADKIKTHHNRVPEILELIKRGKIIEPVSELYKDEVRELGTALGLPTEMVWKHPFPGPALAVRMLCAKDEDLPANAGGVEAGVAKFLEPHGLKSKILPIKSVGVQGDLRTYRHPLVVWGHATDGNFSWDFLEEISTALTNRFDEINRVCLLVAPEKIESVKVIQGDVNADRVANLQELDDIVMSFVYENGIGRDMWQFPTVLIPISVNGVDKEAVVLRPICSDEAMTANFYKMDSKLLEKLAAKLIPHVSAVFFDITNKPPGTIEWE